MKALADVDWIGNHTTPAFRSQLTLEGRLLTLSGVHGCSRPLTLVGKQLWVEFASCDHCTFSSFHEGALSYPRTALVCMYFTPDLLGSVDALQRRQGHFTPEGHRKAFSVSPPGTIRARDANCDTESELASSSSSRCLTRLCWSSTCMTLVVVCYSNSCPAISPCSIKPFTTTTQFVLGSICCHSSCPRW